MSELPGLEVFATFAQGLPEDPDATDNPEVVVSRRSLPRPGPLLATDRIVVQRFPHSYNTHFEVDGVVLFADKATLRALGVLLLATVLHGLPQVVEVH